MLSSPAQPGALSRFRRQPGIGRAALGLFGVVMAVLLLLPTLQNMYEVNYVHSADGPHEMMVYVQTPDDINSVMARIASVDQQDFGGKHQVQIGITTDAIYPFIWYLRDYPNVCAPFPTNCPTWQNTASIIIGSSGDPAQDINVYDSQKTYLYRVYPLRTWWDQGYKLQACPPGHYSPGFCSDPNQGSGVGPLLWLSYGDNPPPGAKFNPGLAIQHIWNWWWSRQPFGSTAGGYDMVLFIRKTMHVQP